MSGQWHKVSPEELAKFVTREAVRLIKLKVDRRAVVKAPGGRRKLVEAIYQALADKGVRYSEEKYQPEAYVQDVRDPGEVLDSPGEGTCLDLAAVFCGVCEGNELLPMIIVLEDHALAAVGVKHGLRDWDAPDRLELNLFERGALREWKDMLKLVDDGTYVAVECTGFTRVPQAEAPETTPPALMQFEESLEAGRKRLQDKEQFKFAVDIAIAHYRWRIKSEAGEMKRVVDSGLSVEEERILQFFRELGSARASDYFLKVAGEELGLTEAAVRSIEEAPLPEHEDRQVAAFIGARERLAREGYGVTPETDYRLGKLAAFRRDYDMAELRLRRAVRARPHWPEAVESFMWLEQSRAMHDLNRQEVARAETRLIEAQEVGRRSKLDLEPIRNLQGYVEKTLAQTAGLAGDPRARRLHLKKASDHFGSVLKMTPKDPAAWNGYANVNHMLLNFSEAEKAYKKAIRLLPTYAAAHHDLALLFEEKSKLDRTHQKRLLRRALDSWKQTYPLAEMDPGFSPEDLQLIEQRITDLSSRLAIKGAGTKGGGFSGAGGFGGNLT